MIISNTGKDVLTNKVSYGNIDKLRKTKEPSIPWVTYHNVNGMDAKKGAQEQNHQKYPNGYLNITN